MTKKTIEFHGKTLSIEVGRMAKQANGSAFIQYGETAVLVTATCGKKNKEGIDFLPLSIEYIEKMSAAGKIPGGFFKREGRQSEREILTSRLTDRPIRPLFPKGYARETQVITSVLSYDGVNDPDVLSLLGASTALAVSDIPFAGPVAAVRVARINGEHICNPTHEQIEQSDLELVVAGSKDAVVMVEGEADIVPEAELLAAVKFAHESLQPLLQIQEEVQKEIGKAKFEVIAPENKVEELMAWVEENRGTKLREILSIKEKIERYTALSVFKDDVVDVACAEGAAFEGCQADAASAIDKIISNHMRSNVLENKIRLDERKPSEIRAITAEVGVLPRTHGSALFTRGETQALVSTTLGTSEDEQIVDTLISNSRERFLLHYNFPPFCVGETKPLRGPARREIGHGFLARKAVEKVLPTKEEFPYTIRVLSDVLESHGSSSMATVCGATLSMMDAGVNIKAPVAGIAMGLVKQDDNFVVLSDISGDEDHIGDMDFKVAGTKDGVTAVQMDIKIDGISWDIMEQALQQAKEGRLHILEKMHEGLGETRGDLSAHAPRIETIQIKPDKIRDVIGTGGKVIRGIVEESGAKVEVNDEGIVKIASADKASLEKAMQMVKDIVAEAEIGKIYKGKVTKVMDYGAFVEILPGKEGLCHISEFLTTEPIEDASEVVSEGDEIEVQVLDVEGNNRIKLSHREVLEPGSSDHVPGSGRDRKRSGGGGRGRGRGGRDSRPRR